MELVIGIVVVGFLIGYVYSSMGGVGAVAAKARQPARPRPSPPPARPALSASATPGGDRFAELESFHANELNAIHLTVAELTPDLLQGVSFIRLGRTMADKLAHLDRRAKDDDMLLKAAGSVEREYLATSAERALRGAAFQRTLRDMNDPERATVRLADLLAEAGEIRHRDRLAIIAPIVWNKGRGLFLHGEASRSADFLHELRATLSVLIEGHLGPSEAAIERLHIALRNALSPTSTLTSPQRTALERALVTGAKWMAPEAAATAMVPQQPPRPSVLRLGRIEGSHQELFYDRNESLVTIAPPGQGKSQSVMRNLLTMDGGAVVIDIKGELFEDTAVWRAREVGPVYRFAPADPANSIHFNPLDFIRNGVADAYEDAQKLVNLLMVPQELGKKDYWDKRGLALLADAILDTALFDRGADRCMSSIFEKLYLEPSPPEDDDGRRQNQTRSELDEWLDHLEQTGIPKLMRTAKAVRAMPYKVRESVTDTARAHIDTWQSPRIEDLTRTTTFDPLCLRRDKATLYVCISLDELAQYTSFFRALVGQTFYSLCRGKADRNAPLVTFFLDEMPKLKRLDILEDALDLGRGYGVRLWMFAQNYGQLAEHYRNPDGFLQNSYVRQFMGIDTALALKLSKEMSQRHGLIDGRRKPLVEPHELTGEAFRDLTLTIMQGHPPARVVKAYGFADHADRIQPASAHDCSGGLLKLTDREAASSSG